ncbi:MAG: isoprenylcysteine carboxylmethyltransferase family protein [Pseudomonadales bacterium]|nr:isoprenylcysteine carboxylmethyltransferase family protein [Pseudomonadales bacterium]
MSNTKRFLCFVYSLICYAAGVASLIFFIFFVNDIFLGKTVNTLVDIESPLQAVLINVLAISLFGIQHSVMARASFKQWLTQYIHPSMERSTYVLSTALVIVGMCYLWVPFGSVIWNVDSEMVALIIRSVAVLGWAFLLIATFMLNHFELFGLSQTFNLLTGKPKAKSQLRMPGFYRIVRHPIQTGVLIGMWALPASTTSHLLFAGGITIYIFVGLYFEEKDLVQEFGGSYVKYMKRVKRVIPFVV